MELKAVLSLRDKLSAKMKQASASVHAMSTQVSQAKGQIARLSEAKGLNINMKTNISEVVSQTKSAVTQLRSSIESQRLEIGTKLNAEGWDVEDMEGSLAQLGSFLEKNEGKVEDYTQKLDLLKQKQSELSDTAKVSTKMGIENQIESLQRKLAEIETAKAQFAQWRDIKLRYDAIEQAELEVQMLEHALQELNSHNVAVRAFLDFKDDALKQVYAIDDKLKAIGAKVISPVLQLRDKLSGPLGKVKDTLRVVGSKVAQPVVKAKDLATSALIKVKGGLAKVAGTIAYPIIKIKDAASPVVSALKEKLNGLKEKVVPYVKLKAQEAFNTIQQLGDKIAGLGAKASKAVGGAVKTVAKGTAIALTGAATIIGGVGAAAINTGSQFEASMSQVAATMGMTADEADYSNESYAKLANTAKALGASTKFSASESAEALNYLALAGYDVDKACTALPTILNLAAAGGMELAAASDMITDSMSALGIEATQSNLTEFGDKMAVAAQKSNTSVSQLGEAILTVGGTAKNLAGGTTELNTLLGIIADNGVKGAEGGTALRNILLSLQSPTDTASKALKNLGVSVFDAEGKMRPMNEVLGDLSKSMDGMTDAQKADALSTIFNKTDLKSVNALLANCGERYDELSGYIENSDGAMQAMADTMNNNLQGRITEFKSAMEGAGIAIYEAIGSGSLKDIVQEASGWVTELTKATEEGGIDGLVNAIGGIFAKVITKVSSLAPQLVSMGVSMVESFISGINSNMSGIVSGLSKTGTVFLKGVLTLMPKLVIAGSQLVIQLAQGFASELPGILAVGLQAVQELAQGIADNTPLAINTAVSIITTLADGLSEAMPGLSQSAIAIIQTLAQGIMSNLSAIMESGLTLLQSLIQGIMTVAPVLLVTGMQIVFSLIQGIAQMLPTLLPMAVQGIMLLIQGFVSMLPSVISVGLQLIVSLVQAILSSLPQLITMGAQAIISFVQGLVSALPMIIQTAVQLIPVMIQGLASNLPIIIQAGIQIILALIQGLAQAIPALLGAIPQIFSAFIEGITSVNWLEVGADIIKSIGSGLLEAGKSILGGIWDGIKSAVFGDADETGTEAVTNLAAGIESGSGQVSTAASTVSTAANTGFTMDTSGIYGQGIDASNSLASGITSGSGNPLTAATGVSASTAGAFTMPDLSGQGLNATNSLASGISMNSSVPLMAASNVADITASGFVMPDISGEGANAANSLATGISSNAGTAIGAASNMSSEVASAAATEVQVKINADVTSLESFKAQINDLAASASTSLQQLPDSFSAALEGANAAVSAAMTQMQGTVTQGATSISTGATAAMVTNQSVVTAGMAVINSVVTAGMLLMVAAVMSGCSQAVASANSCASSIRSAFAGVNLYSSGVYMMSGLINGMNAMRGSVMATAASIASAAASSINNALKIHSPSRVTTDSGEFTGEGLAVGMKNSLPEVEKSAESVAEVAASAIEPKRKPNYDGLLAAKPVESSGESSVYNNSSSSENKVVKKIYKIDKIIENVTITNEADEDRLVRKVLEALAEDFDDTADNMGEEDE